MFSYTPSGHARDTIVCAVIKGKLVRSKPKDYDRAQREISTLKQLGHPAWLEARSSL